MNPAMFLSSIVVKNLEILSSKSELGITFALDRTMISTCCPMLARQLMFRSMPQGLSLQNHRPG